jgi:DNA repair protein RadC
MMTLKTLERSPRLAELKVSYKRKKCQKPGQDASGKPLVDPRTAEEYLRAVWNWDTFELIEDFVVVFLDSRYAPLGWVRASSGGIDRTTVDPRIIFGIALQTAASALIVAHNHPSGSIEPSPEDVAVTARLRDAGKLLSVTLLDHVILGKNAAFSFADSGNVL